MCYIDTVKDYISEHYSEEWYTAELAKLAYVSPEHLCREFKKHTGEKMSHYINRIRIEKSLTDLVTTDQSIEEILYRHGFNSVRSYYNFFRKFYNTTPAQYRAVARRKNQ